MRKILICLLFLVLISLLSSQPSNINTFYLNYARKIDATDVLVSPKEVSLQQLLSTDDSPFVPVTLPFPIVLFNEIFQRLYVNPNGGIHRSLAQPCHLNDFASTSPVCNTNTTYYGMVAGYLNDMQLSKSCPGADVVYFNTSDRFTVAFRRVCYFGTLFQNTFRMTIFRDYHIEIAYDRITKTLSYPPPGWLSGVRFPKNNGYAITFTEEMKRWKNDITGVYPTPAQVNTGNKFVVCPISTLWCLKNSTVPLPGLSEQEISLSTTQISCTKDVSYTLSYSFTADTSDGPNSTLSCFVSGPSARMTCSLSRLARRVAQFSGQQQLTVFLWLSWRELDSSTQTYAVIAEIPPLQLIVLNSSSLLSLSSSCFVNEFPANSSARCSQKNCSLCDQDFSCLDNSCYRQDSLISVYSDRSCDGVCREADDLPSLTQTNVTDPDGRCCAVGALDCAGVCHGNNTLAIDVYGNNYCCPDGIVVDCEGICGGSSVLDVGGVCGGEDLIGYSCFNDSTVTLSSPTQDYAAIYPQFDLKDKVFNVSDYLFINNLSNRDINATALVTPWNRSHEDPIVTFHNQSLLRNTLIIPRNSSVRVSFNVSMESFYHNPDNRFVSKLIELQYNPIGLPLAKYVLTIQVNPQFTSCHLLEGIHSCMSFPGCMYCLTFKHVKVVRSNKKSIVYYYYDQDINLLDSGEGLSDALQDKTKQHGRRLFSSLIPNPYKVKKDELLDGVCIDGLYQSACDRHNHDMLADYSGALPQRTVSMLFLTGIGIILSIVM